MTDASFSQVLDAPMAIVDFLSPSCPHCMEFKPIFEAAAAQSGDKILFVEANVNDVPQNAGTFKVQVLPTIVFLANGKEVDRIEGSPDQADFMNEIGKAFGGGAGPISAAPAAAARPSSGISLGTMIGGLALVGVISGIGYLISKQL